MNERLNIRRMQVPETQTAEGPFDAARELTKADWKSMEDEREHLLDFAIGSSNWDPALNVTAEMIVLNPQHPHGLTQEDLKRFRSVAERRFKNQRYLGAIEGLARLQMIDPTWKLELSESDWEWMNQELSEELVKQLKEKRPYLGSVIEAAAAMRLLDPTREIALSRDDYDRIEKSIERDFAHPNMRYFFLQDASLARILSPSISLPVLTAEDWNKMREMLEEARVETGMMARQTGVTNWSQFAKIASNLKILAASSVEVSKQGLKLGPPSKLAKDAIQRPRPEALQL